MLEQLENFILPLKQKIENSDATASDKVGYYRFLTYQETAENNIDKIDSADYEVSDKYNFKKILFTENGPLIHLSTMQTYRPSCNRETFQGMIHYPTSDSPNLVFANVRLSTFQNKYGGYTGFVIDDNGNVTNVFQCSKEKDKNYPDLDKLITTEFKNKESEILNEVTM